MAVIWNSRSGWSEDQQNAAAVRDILARADYALDFHRIEKGDDLLETCRNCLNSGARVLVAAGGDGTVNAVASSVVNSDVRLGVIPAGTLNHFARDLAIPIDPGAAAHALAAGREASVDVGAVNGRIFINNSVLGLYPVYRAAKEAFERKGLKSTRLGRFFAVIGGILRVFWRLPHLHLRFIVNGTDRDMRTAFVLVANNEHELEDWNIGRRRSLGEGLLWVYALRPCSRWALLKFFVLFVFKRFRKRDAFDVFKVRELHIEARRRRHIRVGVDGEIVQLENPLYYESLPRALRVIAPAAYFEGKAGMNATATEIETV
ncbi:MAG: NAD(+)/NADH kinase [Acidobacteriaceae bacterium]|nr:NAD(+)/NADH kinase [Acidobacteriaceae bacterium]